MCCGNTDETEKIKHTNHLKLTPHNSTDKSKEAQQMDSNSVSGAISINPMQGGGSSTSQSNTLNLESFLIEFQNITLTLKTGVTVMKGVHGSFKPGRLCAIMGPSGKIKA